MLRLSTINVNGLRAAARKGYVEWFAATDADVVALQEVRAEPEQLPDHVLRPEGWHAQFAPSAIKGRAGVALLSRREPQAVRVGFGDPEFDTAGRYVECEFERVVVGSVYLPSGEAGTPKQAEKERFMGAFLLYLAQLRRRVAAAGKQAVMMGDFNIAHTENDLKNWRGNRKNSGFLPEEREWLTRLYEGAGYVDVHRKLVPDGPGPYTWWSMQGRAFDNDAGWRIDLQVATAELAESAVSARVERAPAWDKRWSDHAPLTITYDWPGL
ncbi:exodeoxyribonuclease III [Thermocrispum agreste]|uniref:exodeoxyribonuclease III n=1 Tax=Thermocrispum agreste TaxID=37925 RepID=UPI000410AED8|nr:exodeoxyribonuclease III [Thermocrispum agreste]